MRCRKGMRKRDVYTRLKIQFVRHFFTVFTTSADPCFVDTKYGGKSCYTDMRINTSFDAGAQMCQTMGGHLPIVLTPDETQFITLMFPDYINIWIGLRSTK